MCYIIIFSIKKRQCDQFKDPLKHRVMVINAMIEGFPE